MKSAIVLVVALPLAAQVSFDRIRQSDAEPGNWLTYSGNYNAQRYSRLDQINAAKCETPAADVGLPDQSDGFVRSVTVGRRRHHVRKRAGGQRNRARYHHRPAALEIPA